MSGAGGVPDSDSSARVCNAFLLALEPTVLGSSALLEDDEGAG